MTSGVGGLISGFLYPALKLPNVNSTQFNLVYLFNGTVQLSRSRRFISVKIGLECIRASQFISAPGVASVTHSGISRK